MSQPSALDLEACLGRVFSQFTDGLNDSGQCVALTSVP